MSPVDVDEAADESRLSSHGGESSGECDGRHREPAAALQLHSRDSQQHQQRRPSISAGTQAECTPGTPAQEVGESQEKVTDGNMASERDVA